MPCRAVSKLTERLEKALDGLVFHFGEGDLATQFPAQARDAELLYSAGCDAVEPAQIGLHVQSEAGGGDPTRRELHAYGGDLVLPYPHTRVFWMAAAREAVGCERPDDDASEVSEVGVGVAGLESQD